ncbi:hypothetical protein Amet_1721 [Alkaliphilus metalliredigens QYMF]|uniref:N-acetyltransferase domain-containing protein n=1 Tax=Alkaliphilus metalliredigens (strain QYMF) TaxID=293826 RepID=A6TNX9_ALKMQ|nr:GNAT family N-acetyltransferase [Alkaliphilus metalliredigens]ABR47897.1 hypothetical protein Amet_1721 [Alkaliphilus metalliredigens QYMF]
MFRIESLEKIKPLLGEDHIAHLNTVGRMNSNPEIEIYVDNLEDPKGFVLREGYWHIPYSRHMDILLHMINSFSWNKEIGFCGIPSHTAQLLREKLLGYELSWDEPCELFYYPNKTLPIESGLESLPSLKPEHVETVNHHYTYKDEDSYEYLMSCIQKNPSSVILDEQNNPISWALVREDHSMGVMYTVDAHRGKGIAEKVTLDLMKKVLNYGNTPYVHIVTDNEKSKNLAIKAGFIHWGPITWFGMERKEG